MENKEKIIEYCPKCGYVGDTFSTSPKICPNCRHQTYEINPKWGITLEKYDEIMAPKKYGEKTLRECTRDLIEFCQPFYEEVVKKHPDFNEEEFLQWGDKLNNMIERYVENIKNPTPPHNDIPKKPTVKCPYCNSTNTKKLSSMSRMFSGGLLGLGSGKIGKQWHCNSCGSDF